MIRGVLQKYREFLPVTERTPLISLGEGGTPLVKSRNLVDEVGCRDLYFKLEGCNPNPLRNVGTRNHQYSISCHTLGMAVYYLNDLLKTGPFPLDSSHLLHVFLV